VTRFYGRRLKPCPGTSNHICCGYHVINAITNCPMDCSYCVLQTYLTNPLLTLYSNWDDMLAEIENFLSLRPQALVRLGTGELSDSLALDPIFPYRRSSSLFLQSGRTESWNSKPNQRKSVSSSPWNTGTEPLSPGPSTRLGSLKRRRWIRLHWSNGLRLQEGAKKKVIFWGFILILSSTMKVGKRGIARQSLPFFNRSTRGV